MASAFHNLLADTTNSSESSHSQTINVGHGGGLGGSYIEAPELPSFAASFHSDVERENQEREFFGVRGGAGPSRGKKETRLGVGWETKTSSNGESGLKRVIWSRGRASGGRPCHERGVSQARPEAQRPSVASGCVGRHRPQRGWAVNRDALIFSVGRGLLESTRFELGRSICIPKLGIEGSRQATDTFFLTDSPSC